MRSDLRRGDGQKTLLLSELRDRQAALIAVEAGESFMGLPERWLAAPHWRCVNGHVSTTILKSELRGDLCLACQSSVVLTSPEDLEEA